MACHFSYHLAYRAWCCLKVMLLDRVTVLWYIICRFNGIVKALYIDDFGHITFKKVLVIQRRL